MASPTGLGRAGSIIDPEALLIASLYLSDEESRLRDMAGWWARVGATLTSVQRFRALAKRFPASSGKNGLSEFAQMAVAAGDRRWSRHAVGPFSEGLRPGKGPEEPELIGAPTLWPRLRAGFGVGAKADTLVFLLGLRGAWASAPVIAFATGYSTVSIRKAASEMASARLIRETEGRPVEYQAQPKPWAELLELHSTREGWGGDPMAPPWRFWSEILAFLIGAIEWSKAARSQPGANEYVLASRARDLVERHQRAFNFNSIPTPPPEAFPGREAPLGLRESTRVVVEWAEMAV
jgi:hypothetical protein